MMIKRIAATAGVAVLMLTAAACGSSKVNSSTVHNQKVEAGQETIYNTNQPIPVFSYSQQRQTLIDVLNAEANPTPTTTFFFNLGVANPVSSCPSIGYPVSATDELSNPDQLTRSGQNGYNIEGAIPQIDPNGIYSGGSSTGTYALCRNNSGTPYAFYWEGYVAAVDGSATWDNATGKISDVSNPTGGFKVLTPTQVSAKPSATPKP